MPNVCKVKSHMCAFGMTGQDEQGEASVKKPTGFMTSAPLLAKQLEKPCTQDHRHIVLSGGKAKRCEVYPDQLCKAIVYELRDQMYSDGRMSREGLGCLCPIDEAFNYEGEFWDDL